MGSPRQHILKVQAAPAPHLIPSCTLPACMCAQGYRATAWKTFLFYLLGLCTLGVSLLLAKW